MSTTAQVQNNWLSRFSSSKTETKTRRYKPGTGPLVAGTIIVVAWILAALLSPVVDPHSALVTVGPSLAPPSGNFLFGTDSLGFDVFSRTLYAARVDLYLAFLGTFFSLVGGALVGMIIGYSDRLWAVTIMRLFDAIQAFPLLILALVFVGALGGTSVTMILAIAIVNLPIFVRVVRGEVLALRDRRFVEAAVVTGNPTGRLLRKHIAPNLIGPLSVQGSVTIASSVLVVAGLSFLGVGVKPPTPEWGTMIQAGASEIVGGTWWPSVFPGLAVLSIVLAFQLVGMGLHQRVGTKAS